jgi:hypothetical protein
LSPAGDGSARVALTVAVDLTAAQDDGFTLTANPMKMSTPKPFSKTPGRDSTRDRPPAFDIATMYYECRMEIAADAPTLNQLIEAIDWPNDLSPTQWAQWYSIVLGFKPDLILELGRGMGNSTALFAQAAWRLGAVNIVSLCLSDHWSANAVPRLKTLVDPNWFKSVDARVADILATDYERIVGDHQRVLVLWDAHGFAIAETILSGILPLIAGREHLILMHDISDNRYAGISRSYEGAPLWKGSVWQQSTETWSSRVNIGWMNSIQDQVIALADFSARNDIEIGSGDHEYASYFAAHPDRAEEMRRVIGDRFFSAGANWAFLSLSGREPPFYFPTVAVRRTFAHECVAVVDELYPRPGRAMTLPRTVETSAVRWAYAALMTCRPMATLPPRAQPSLRLRVHVAGAPIGIGLLNADQSDFLERRLVPSGSETETVFLPIVDNSNAGPVVIHTWDVAESSRVRIDDIAVVW